MTHQEIQDKITEIVAKLDHRLMTKQEAVSRLMQVVEEVKNPKQKNPKK